VISTHDMDLAWEWADEVAVLVEGCTARQASVTDIFADTALLHQARLRQPWLPEIIAHLQAAGILPATSTPPRSCATLAAAFAEFVNKKSENVFSIKQLTRVDSFTK